MASKKSAKNNKPKKVVASSTPETAFADRLRNISFGESRAYLFEYGLLLLVVGALVGTLASMLREIVRYVVDSLRTDAFGYEMSLLNLSTVVVLLPLAVILIQRTAESERINLLIKNTSWRKAFLGIFLAVITLAAIVLTISFVHGIISYLASSETRFEWAERLGELFIISMLASTAWVFGYDYRYTATNTYVRWQHFYRYALVFGAVLISVGFIVGPLSAERDGINTSRHYFEEMKCGGDDYDFHSENKYRLEQESDVELVQPDLQY